MMVLEPALVATDALFDIVERTVEGLVGVAAEGMGDEGLPGGEADPAVRLEKISLLGDDDLGLAAAVEIF